MTDREALERALEELLVADHRLNYAGRSEDAGAYKSYGEQIKRIKATILNAFEALLAERNACSGGPDYELSDATDQALAKLREVANPGGTEG